jgi:hypothetical protein
VKAATVAIDKISDQLTTLNARLDAIEKADRDVRLLRAYNASVWKNGALHFDPNRFAAALQEDPQ